MKFVWEMDEKRWTAFANAFNNKDFEAAYNEGEYIGCCRVGDLCFDIRAWNGGEWTGWGFELFCGGVDTGYGYSVKEAMENGKYHDKYDVPDELTYPYDEVSYGEFQGFEILPDVKEFKKKAEESFISFINEHCASYKYADLIAKANEALHIW